MSIALPAAQLVIFCLFFIPNKYCLFWHGVPGFLAWFHVGAFLLIRIIGCGLQIGEDGNPGDTGVLIVNNIGLSPMLLAAFGVLHEARIARASNLLGSKIEGVFIFLYHLTVGAGTGLIASGISNLAGDSPDESDRTIVKVGFAIMLACWFTLASLALTSLRPRYPSAGAAAGYADGTKLLYAVLISIPLICLRGIYGVVAALNPSRGFSTSLAAEVCLSVVPSLLTAVAFVVTGVLTWRINIKSKCGRVRTTPSGNVVV